MQFHLVIPRYFLHAKNYRGTCQTNCSLGGKDWGEWINVSIFIRHLPYSPPIYYTYVASSTDIISLMQDLFFYKMGSFILRSFNF
jgi:hypothetical protein